MAGFKLFGYTFMQKEPSWEVDTQDIKKDAVSFVDKDSESTAAVVSSSYASGVYLDVAGNLRGEADLVSKYREMSIHPEMDSAIDEVTNECITTEDDFIVKLDLTRIEMLDDNAKLVLQSVHNEILDMLDFQSKGYWIFRRWYIDGRIYYHCVTDPKHLEEGIKELRYIDPRKLREVKEVTPQKVPGAADPNQPAHVMQQTADYYLYNEKGFGAKSTQFAGGVGAGMNTQGIRITKDSIVHVPSGLTDPNGLLGVSYLQKSVKILSMLKTMEDALVIYRLSRAPERRVWYVDVGNLPKQKADQYVRKVMTDQKNKLVYNSGTGEIQDTRKFLTMTEDYWLPKRADGSGTRVDTIPGGQTLGQIDDVLYFQKLLYNSLNVPVERLQSDSPFQMGQGDQITRAEIKFDKFCTRLKQQFSLLFREALKKQCVLKGLMSIEEFQVLEKLIKYEFAKDSHFAELKDQQITMQRAQAFAALEQSGIIGRIYSMRWVRHEIFQQNDDDILEQTMEIIEDMQNPIYNMMNPSSPQGQAAAAQGGQEEEQPQEEQQDDPGDEETPEGSKNDHEQKLQRAKTIIAAIKSIPEKKRTPGDATKLRSAAQLVAKNPKHSADKE